MILSQAILPDVHVTQFLAVSLIVLIGIADVSTRSQGICVVLNKDYGKWYICVSLFIPNVSQKKSALNRPKVY